MSCARQDTAPADRHIVLQTQRLVLRRFTAADVENLVELDSDPQVMRYLTGGKPTPRERIVQEIIPRNLDYYVRYGGLGIFAAEEAQSGRFIGWFIFRPKKDGPLDDVELGYRLRRDAWGKGYATEGSLALIDKGFREWGVQRIWAWTMAVNTRSRRVMEKLGMTLVREFHAGGEPIEGSERGDVEYAITRETWQRAAAAAAPSQ